jgi:crossover junction endodeoxyribonuclease RusA
MGHTRPILSISITLPLPKKELSPNGRFHYHAKRRAAKEYRMLARLRAHVCTNAEMPKHERAEVRIRWFTKTARKPDSDNALASLKSAFDGIADSGFLSNDRGLTFHPIEFQKDNQNPRVQITVTAHLIASNFARS